ncbi:MAG: Bax inhibitor-1/YccA family protein [Candidatus Phosphoribacter sp.]|nr:Bax inhibitor-1/YccA family protein [Actinomycetales bacterium]
MAGNNPVFNRIDKQLREERYAGFGDQRAPKDSRAPQGYQGQPGYLPPPPMDSAQLDELYQRPSAGPLDTGRVTFDDVIVKTLTLFALVLGTAGLTWVLTSSAPSLTMPIWLAGMFGGLVVGLVIGFKKSVSVPLILAYAILEGAFVGAFSRVMEGWYPGIVMTAVVATLATFAGMFLGYRAGFIKVTSRSRRIFGMAVMGYLLFSLVNVLGLFLGWTSGWGFGGTGLLGIGISILGVGLASYSLAVDFDSVEQGVRMGAPEKYSWLFAHGIIVSLVWLYIEILRLLARLRGD